jgi:hypothetical protein
LWFKHQHRKRGNEGVGRSRDRVRSADRTRQSACNFIAGTCIDLTVSATAPASN